jgi:hypothetical protein
MGKLIIIAILVYGTYKCTGGGLGTDSIFGPPDTLPLSRYEDVDVSVYFFFPNNDKEYYLGDTRGASGCGDMAYAYAADNQLSRNNNWTYICCTHEADSDCYRKIR